MCFRDLKVPKDKAKVEDMQQYLTKWMCPVLFKKQQILNSKDYSLNCIFLLYSGLGQILERSIIFKIHYNFSEDIIVW